MTEMAERLEAALVTLAGIHVDEDVSPATRVAAARAIISAGAVGVDGTAGKGTSEMTAKQLEQAAGDIKRRLQVVNVPERG